jgi:hypothetical protein
LIHICWEHIFPFNKVYKGSYWPSFIKFQVPKNFHSNIPWFQLIEASLNFNSQSIQNLEKLLLRQLFISLRSFPPFSPLPRPHELTRHPLHLLSDFNDRSTTGDGKNLEPPALPSLLHGESSPTRHLLQIQALPHLTPPILLRAAGPHRRHHQPPKLTRRRRTPPPEAACATSPLYDVFTEPHRPPPCLAPP